MILNKKFLIKLNKKNKMNIKFKLNKNIMIMIIKYKNKLYNKILKRINQNIIRFLMIYIKE